ncbi:PepSY-like domain-containing protein [Proteiniphilum sp.]|uniref:PepSY-like domain-containing protein n=1 Tax=Proteiniphilum sp. TaxID=1926877 RepID=UPI00331B4178
MKKPSYILLSVLMLIVVACDSEDAFTPTPIDQGNLPKKVQEFLGKHFNGSEFMSAQFQTAYGVSYYDVKLKTTQIGFDVDGEWMWMITPLGLPESAQGILDSDVLKELNQKAPNSNIVRLDNRYNREIDLVMDDGKYYIEMEGDEGKVLAELAKDDELPKAMSEYIEQYAYGITRGVYVDVMPEYTYPKKLKFTMLKGDIYRYKFGLDTFVDFDKDGNWFYLQEEETAAQQIIADRLIMAVPESVLNKLKTVDQWIVPRIRKINLFNDNKDYGFNKIYGFTLDDGRFVAINSENEVLEIPYNTVRDYIDKGFNPGREYKVYAHVNTGGAFLFRYSFVITGWSSDPYLAINLTTNAQGEMRRISSGVVSTDHTRVTPLPRAVVEMLSHPIADYLDEHYPDWKAVSIDCAYSEGYGPEIPQQTINVMMSVPNNLKTAVFDYATGEFIEEYLAIQR